MKRFILGSLIIASTLSCSRKESAQLEILYYLELTDSLRAYLPNDYEGELKKAGWEIYPNHIQMRVLPKDATLIEKDKQIKKAKGGIYTVGMVASDSLPHSDIVEWDKEWKVNGAIYLQYPRLSVSNKEYMLLKYNNDNTLRLYQNLINYQCCKPARAGNGEGDPMEDLRCLDYNGLNSDGKNRPKSDPVAAVNFLNSDCQLALKEGHCWSEHLGAFTGCQKNHDGKICSVLIGHSTDYHMH